MKRASTGPEASRWVTGGIVSVRDAPPPVTKIRSSETMPMLVPLLALLLAPSAAFRLLLPSGAVVAQRQPARVRSVSPVAIGPQLDGAGAFRDIQEYPCDLLVKIIGDNEGPFVADMLTLCAERTGQKEDEIEVRWRDKGKYRSITLKLHFENADQVYDVYAAINRDPRVRFKL